MHLIANVIRISRAKFHCNRLTTAQDIEDYASLIFWHTLYQYTIESKKVKLKVKCICITLIFVVHARCSGMDHTVLPAITPMPAFTS